MHLPLDSVGVCETCQCAFERTGSFTTFFSNFLNQKNCLVVYRTGILMLENIIYILNLGCFVVAVLTASLLSIALLISFFKATIKTFFK